MPAATLECLQFAVQAVAHESLPCASRRVRGGLNGAASERKIDHRRVGRGAIGTLETAEIPREIYLFTGLNDATQRRVSSRLTPSLYSSCDMARIV